MVWDSPVDRSLWKRSRADSIIWAVASVASFVALVVASTVRVVARTAAAPAPKLRQALSDPHGRYGLAWQIDLKAGWSYGIAPGAATTAGPYPVRGGDPTRPGRMPAWLAHEVIRVTTAAPRQPATPPLPSPGGPGPAAYLATVIGRGAVQLAALTDGRKRALSALGYHAGGLLAWSGADRGHITGQLIDAGTAAGLGPGIATRIVNRAITNGIDRPVRQPDAHCHRIA